jgi:hypothetical protein
MRAKKPGAGPAKVRVAATAAAKNINGGNENRRLPRVTSKCASSTVITARPYLAVNP